MNIKASLLNCSLIWVVLLSLGSTTPLAAQNMTWRPVGLDKIMSGAYNDGDSVVYFMGLFSNYDNQAGVNYMVKMMPDESIAYFPNSYPFYFPWVACRYQGDLYVGGYGLFKLDGNNWQLIDSSNMVNVLTVIDGKLLIGGWFTRPAHFLGQLSTSIVSYDGTKFENFHNIDTISNSVAVRSIIEYKGKIYVGGNFDPFPPYNTDRKEIVRWNGSNWEAVGQGIKGGGSDIVNSMAVMDDTLYVAGMMQEAVGGPGNGIAQYDGTNWHNMGGGVNNWNNVNGISVINDVLYITGNFGDAGGQPSSVFAAYKNGEWCTNDVPFDYVTNGVLEFQGKTYVWGNFWTIGGDSSKSLVELTGTPGCFTTLGVEEVALSASAYSVYPNPAVRFNIQWKRSPLQPITYMVTDITGRVVWQEQSKKDHLSIEAAQWPSGLYFLQMEKDHETFVEKLVKQ